LPNIFQNNFFPTRETAPLEELKPELFFKKPELCQTSSIYLVLYVLDFWIELLKSRIVR